METWIGPAIVAAFIAALVSVAGWLVTTRQALALERIRRQEKTRDFQIALRAEIRSELADLEAYDFDADLDRVKHRYEEDPSYSVLVPDLPRPLIFEAVLPEIHLLQEEVIDPVVLYMRQRQVVGSAVADIRDGRFKDLATGRQLEVYREYIELRRHLALLTRKATIALERPLSR